MDLSKGYEKIKAWQKGMDIVHEVYILTSTFPKSEIYGLSSQMRRASVSIPSNIAEGYRRKGKEYGHFLTFAFGSGSELETQLKISRRLGYATQGSHSKIELILEEVMKLLNVMIKNCR
ncbi:MAG: four helix bundle protein [Candidatus Pacebacteria bacterium]|nr:four helix bundle protein [Candidatus Paceibacterota bacterium]